jgi:hypothetical protein
LDISIQEGPSSNNLGPIFKHTKDKVESLESILNSYREVSSFRDELIPEERL